jgi:hypothetical protein
MYNTAGEILCLQGQLMKDLNQTAVEANKLQAQMILTEAQMASSEATSTLRSGLMQANGQAISGALNIIGGAAAITGGCVGIAGNIGEAKDLANINQLHAQNNVIELEEVGGAARPGGMGGAADRDPGLSDERLAFERAKIEKKWDNYAKMSGILQSTSTLMSQGLGSLLQSFYTAEGAVAQADAQRAAATGKAISGIRASIDSVAQGAQSMFGQVANNTSQTLQYVIALSQAH